MQFARVHNTWSYEKAEGKKPVRLAGVLELVILARAHFDKVNTSLRLLSGRLHCLVSQLDIDSSDALLASPHQRRSARPDLPQPQRRAIRPSTTAFKSPIVSRAVEAQTSSTDATAASNAPTRMVPATTTLLDHGGLNMTGYSKPAVSTVAVPTLFWNASDVSPSGTRTT